MKFGNKTSISDSLLLLLLLLFAFLALRSEAMYVVSLSNRSSACYQ